jgi:hypothetical protein
MGTSGTSTRYRACGFRYLANELTNGPDEGHTWYSALDCAAPRARARTNTAMAIRGRRK